MFMQVRFIQWRANGVIDGLRFSRDGDQTLEQA
jgi:hypothetical protein